MAKNPEKVTIKIKKEDLNDLDEITIEILQQETAVDKAISKSLASMQTLHQKTKVEDWGHRALRLFSLGMAIMLLIAVICMYYNDYILNKM